MTRFMTNTSLPALATAALLSVGVSAASAQEFTVPNGAYSDHAAITANQRAPEFTALAFRVRSLGGENGQTATGGPAGGPNQGG
jgi:hypothetical protein